MLSGSLATQVDGALRENASAHSAVTDRKEIQRDGNGQISFRGQRGGLEQQPVRLVGIWVSVNGWTSLPLCCC